MNLTFNKIVSLLLIGSLCCQCYNQKWTAVADKSQAPITDKRVLLHWRNSVMPVAHARFVEDSLLATKVSFTPEFAQAHVYIDSSFGLPMTSTTKIAIPLAHIDKIETSEHDAKKSVGIVLGFVAATLILLIFFMPFGTGITYDFGGPYS